jgi:hypothetical protein
VRTAQGFLAGRRVRTRVLAIRLSEAAAALALDVAPPHAEGAT